MTNLFDTELESSVLATAIGDAETHREICGWSPDLFGNPLAKSVFTAMCRLASRGAPADPLLLVGEFSGGDKVMMQNFIAGLASRPLVRTASHLSSFEDRLGELSKLRSIHSAAENAMGLMRDGGSSSEVSAAMEEYSASHIFGRSKGVEIGDAAHAVTARARELIRSGNTYAGLPTGYQPLDHCIGGLTNGHLILLAGFTNIGKSAFAIQLCYNALRHGNRVGYISMELSSSDIAERMITLSGQVTTDTMRTLGTITPEELVALDKVALAMHDLPLVVMDRPSWSMNEVRAESRRLKRKGCKLIVIDLLGKVHIETKKQDSRARELELVAVQTKALAKELDIPIIGCVQLNRQSLYDNQAELHHLKDSNGLAENADEVIILDRRNPKVNDFRIFVKVRKSRRGSNHADLPFKFNPSHQSFEYEPVQAL